MINIFGIGGPHMISVATILLGHCNKRSQTIAKNGRGCDLVILYLQEQATGQFAELWFRPQTLGLDAPEPLCSFIYLLGGLVGISTFMKGGIIILPTDIGNGVWSQQLRRNS